MTLENCAKFIECRQTGREYVSPQRRIEELEAELARYRKAVAELPGWYQDDVADALAKLAGER